MNTNQNSPPNRGNLKAMLTPPIPARPQPLTKDPLPTQIPTYREASGKTTREARRCLKRYIARHLYHSYL